MTAPHTQSQPEADALRQHSPTPWRPCHHLQSAEKDASCKCGYRGGIWDGTESVLICEMGNCDQHEGHDMVSVGDRATQLANAAFIVEAVNSHATLQARVEELTKALAECLNQLGWRNLTDDELRHEIELGNGMASIILRARSALPLEQSGSGK